MDDGLRFQQAATPAFPVANSTVKTEYITLGGRPLALVDGGTLYYVHPDHLGTPRKMTDSNGAVVWDAVTRPFGEVEQITGSASNGQRFPGQIYDAETGFHYNYFRDYAPALGRYVQSDPIGLGGGLNTYGYVHQNPVIYTDPTGELVPQLVGAAIGMGLEYWINPCASVSDIALAGALGAFGGGISKKLFLRYGPRSFTRETGKEWSHSIGRATVNRYTTGRLNGMLNQRGGLNGSWTSPIRHHRHDLSRHISGSGQIRKLPAPLRVVDRIPDWLKGSAGSGIAAAAIVDYMCECDQ